MSAASFGPALLVALLDVGATEGRALDNLAARSDSPVDSAAGISPAAPRPTSTRAASLEVAGGLVFSLAGIEALPISPGSCSRGRCWNATSGPASIASCAIPAWGWRSTSA